MRYQVLRSDIEVKVSSIMTSGTGSGVGKEVSTVENKSLSFDMLTEKGTGGCFATSGAASFVTSSWVAATTVRPIEAVPPPSGS